MYSLFFLLAMIATLFLVFGLGMIWLTRNNVVHALQSAADAGAVGAATTAGATGYSSAGNDSFPINASQAAADSTTAWRTAASQIHGVTLGPLTYYPVPPGGPACNSTASGWDYVVADTATLHVSGITVHFPLCALAAIGQVG
jgi:hypothetical protein